MVFHWVFDGNESMFNGFSLVLQRFREHRVFARMPLEEHFWNPKIAPRAFKCAPGAAQERPRAAQERPRAAKSENVDFSMVLERVCGPGTVG